MFICILFIDLNNLDVCCLHQVCSALLGYHGNLDISFEENLGESQSELTLYVRESAFPLTISQFVGSSLPWVESI